MGVSGKLGDTSVTQGSFKGLPYFGVLIIRILPFRVQNRKLPYETWGVGHFSDLGLRLML